MPTDSPPAGRAAHETIAPGMQEACARMAAAQHHFGAELLARIGATPSGSELFRVLVEALLQDPERVQAVHASYYAEQFSLWRHFAAPSADAALPALPHDPRFSAAPWSLPWFDYLRRSHAALSRWLQGLIDGVRMEETARARLRFHARQFIDAAAPSNFLFTNPEALQHAFATGGQSVVRGLQHLLEDASKGRVAMTDEKAFVVGRDLAVTPGAVVYRNSLFELIQYRPATERVRRRALLVVPPCINKYYILDLRPQNSFVRYAVENGLQVFMISWRDVQAEDGHRTWDDYLQHGVAEAIAVARRINRARTIHTLGFCVGGTLLAATLAVLGRKRQRPAASLTLLGSLLDFGDPGEIAVFLDDAYLRECVREAQAKAIVPGIRLAAAFASLRANELVWRPVVNHYLKGEDRPAFDLLYWNSDAANLPAPMYAYYVQRMYRDNALSVPDALRMWGVPVDLARIALPSYVLAAERDHIVPWRSVFASARLLGNEVTFVLAGSGHIAGVVNPPQPPRRGYRTGAGPCDTDDAEQWLSASQTHPGSWWPHWLRWIGARAGSRIDAPATLGNGAYPVLEAAPGRYVREGGANAAVGTGTEWAAARAAAAP